MAAARTGDRRAWSKLYRHWQPRLLAHAWMLTSDREMARDCSAQGWGDIFAGLAKLRDDRAFAAWAYRIVTRKCAAAIGRKQQRRRHETPLEDAPEPATEAEMVVERVAIERAMAKLPGEQRAAIALAYGSGMSIAEIAIAMDAPEGTIKTRLMHARHKLRAALGEDEEIEGE